MVVLQGGGAILIAVGLGQETDARSLGWLYVYGVVRLLVSGFMTDREPERLRSLTRTGRIHMLLAGTAVRDRGRGLTHRLDGGGRRSRPSRVAGHGNGDRDRNRDRGSTDSTCRTRTN